MAIPVNKDKARETPCTCFKIDVKGGEEPENLLCFSEGMIGSLSDRQDEEFCTQFDIQTSKALQERFKRFREIGAINDVCLEGAVQDDEVRQCFIKGAELLDEGLKGKLFEKRLAKEFGVAVD